MSRGSTTPRKWILSTAEASRRASAAAGQGGRAKGAAPAVTVDPQPHDSRSLAFSLLVAIVIHAGIGAALLFAFWPTPSIVRLPVDIDFASTGLSAPTGIVSPPVTSPRLAAARGAPSSQHTVQSPAAPAGAHGRGASTRPDAQAGGDTAPGTDWDMTSPGMDRPPVFVVRPEIPAWVDERGGVLTVMVSFVVSPNGIVSGARVASSSGFPDVDSAVVDAVMMWHFSSDPSAGTVTSMIRYVVKGRAAR